VSFNWVLVCFGTSQAIGRNPNPVWAAATSLLADFIQGSRPDYAASARSRAPVGSATSKGDKPLSATVQHLLHAMAL
jgi:hypothetical protein